MGYDYLKDVKALAVCTVALFLKMLFVGFYTGWARGKEATPAAPEDRAADKTPLSGGATANSRVERGLSMHRNDLENIPIFLILATLLLLTSGLSRKASDEAHIVYYAVFTAARFAHTICYMLAIPKLRGVCWGIGVLATLAVAIHLLIQVFTPIKL